MEFKSRQLPLCQEPRDNMAQSSAMTGHKPEVGVGISIGLAASAPEEKPLNIITKRRRDCAVMATAIHARQDAAAVNKAVTPLGPLETFVPPSSCFTEFEWSVTQDRPQTAIADWGGRNSAGNSCYPSRSALATGQYFSPGVCPEGWTAVSTVVGSSTTSSLSASQSPTSIPGPRSGAPTVLSPTASSTASSTPATVLTSVPTQVGVPNPLVPIPVEGAAQLSVQARSFAHVAHERRVDTETTLLCCPRFVRSTAALRLNCG